MYCTCAIEKGDDGNTFGRLDTGATIEDDGNTLARLVGRGAARRDGGNTLGRLLVTIETVTSGDGTC